MPYSPTTWVSGTTPTSAPNMNNIETGISGAYTELESITGNDGVTQATTDGPFTLANFINYILKAIRNITGSANWYDTPAATLASLNTNKANLSGATFTGAISGTSSTMSGAVSATTLAGTLTDTPGGNGIVAHDEGTAIQLKPSITTRGVDIDYRDSGGVLHHGISISATGGVDFPQGAPTASGGVKIPLTGSHSAGALTISRGNGAPASLDANEIYFQLS